MRAFRVRPAIVLLAALSCVPTIASAQSAAFPHKPITIIVGQPPGGTTDISGRTFAQKLTSMLGQTVIVENRPGVSGMLAASGVARAPADGYTLLYAPNTLLSAPHLLPKNSPAQIDVLKDLAPVVVPTSSSIVLIANPSLGVHNAAELVALVKKTPGIAYASSGSGSNMHIAAEMFMGAAGISMQHVPYKGVAPAVADVVAGHVKVGFNALGVVAPYLASGRLVILGVADDQRNPLMPELPTLKEQGYANTSAPVWYGLFAPVATPTAVIATLNKAFNDALNDPEMKTRLGKQWETPLGGPPAKLQALAQAEYEATGKLIRDLKITAD